MCTQETNKNVLSHTFVIEKNTNKIKTKNSNNTENDINACYRRMIKNILE